MAEITYRQEGDYQIPNLTLNDTTDRPIGKYGRMRKRWLKEHNGALYSNLLLAEKLMEHLAEIDETARNRVEQIMQEMLKKDPAPDRATRQMEWVRHMNNLKASAEEIVMAELIYS